MCVFGNLVDPEAAAVAMLIKAQWVELSAPFLDLHAGHVTPYRADCDVPFLENVTLKELCDTAKECSYPLTKGMRLSIGKSLRGESERVNRRCVLQF